VAEALWYERGPDACTMEALACRVGLKLAVQLGLRRVQLESDCLPTVQLWKRKDMQCYILDPILKETEEISHAFYEFSFSHNSRNCNKVAHCLARQVSSSHCLEVWLDALTCMYDSIDFEASTS
jgi:hypothetical protein